MAIIGKNFIEKSKLKFILKELCDEEHLTIYKISTRTCYSPQPKLFSIIEQYKNNPLLTKILNINSTVYLTTAIYYDLPSTLWICHKPKHRDNFYKEQLHINLLQKSIFIREFISKAVSKLPISTTIQNLKKDFKFHLHNYNIALQSLLNLLKKQKKIKDSNYSTEEIIQLISNNEPTSNISTTATRPTLNKERKCYSPTVNLKRKKFYSLTPLQNFIKNNFK